MTLHKPILKGTGLEWFVELGYEFGQGQYLAAGEPAGELYLFSDVVLVGRLHEAIRWQPRSIPRRGPGSLRSTLLPKLLGGELSVS